MTGLFELHGIRPTLPGNGNIWLAHGAVVVGDVVLREETSVWFNAVVRGDNEQIVIGRGSNVQDGCALHSDPGFPLTIGENCTVGHAAILHGCTLEDNVLIGMGATILNGAVIGAGSIVGANALVTEGKQIPAGSLVVGAPGNVVRKVDGAAKSHILISAEYYRNNMRRFREGLKAIGNPA